MDKELQQAAEILQRIYFPPDKGVRLNLEQLELLARMLQEDKFRSQVFEAWDSIYTPE